ncbi:MAG TPA: c-type cytochrome [Pirellulales bacterium]|nr:c-type cytochrome [Pirellulales bacterium]
MPNRVAAVRTLSVLLLLALSMAMSSVRQAQADPNVVDAPPLSPQEQLKKFHLPPGFEIQLVAAEPECRKPINLNFDSRGRLYFTQSIEYPFPAKPGAKGRDTVKIIDGFDEHGHAAKIGTFVDGLNIPIGVTPIPDGVVVYSIPDIWRCTDPGHTGQVTDRKVIYGDFQYHDTHGMNSSFTRWLDGWIYANHGYTNDDTVAGRDGWKIHMQSGNTYRMRADGSHLEYWSHGRVNPFGICFDPLGNMFVSDCETLPIYLHLREAYYPSFGKPDDGLGFGPPMMDHMHGSSAIAGIVYYAAEQFPAEYRGTMFIGNPVTHRINHDRLTPRGSFFWADGTDDFLSCDDQWFRPVDLKLGPDGAIYVADFYNRIIGHYEVPLTHPGRDHDRGRIWRIVYVGTKDHPAAKPAMPNLATMSAAELIDRLADANITIRTLATNELVDRIGKAAVVPLVELLSSDKSTPTQRAHGLWVLQRLGALDDKLVLKLAIDPDRMVRVHLVRAMAERPNWGLAHLAMPAEQNVPVPLSAGHAPAGSKESLDVMKLVRGRLDDSDAFVRRVAAEALEQHPAIENIKLLADLWGRTPAEDTHLIQTCRIALRDQLAAPSMYVRLKQTSIPGSDTVLRGRMADVSLGVPSADAARFLLEYIEITQKEPNGSIDAVKHSTHYIGDWNPSADRSPLANYVHHVARYLPPDELPKLFAAMRTWHQNATPLDRQRDLLRAVRQGMQEQGQSKLPGDFQTWADDITGKLLASNEEGQLNQGIDLAREWHVVGQFDRLAAIVSGSAAVEWPKLRAPASDACVALDAIRSVALLSGVVGRGNEPLAVRQKAAQALAAINTPAAHDELLHRLPAAPERLAVDIAASLAGSRTGGTLLLATIHDGKASARLLREPTVISRLNAQGIPDLAEQVKTLTAKLPRGDDRLDRLIQQRHDGYLKFKPDPALGRQAFNKICTNCHRIGGEGHKVGPDLDGIGIRGLDRLLEDVLDPNRIVDQAFRATQIQTDDGRSFTGLVVREEGQTVVLVDNQGKETQIAKSNVAERRILPLSPMPANVADILSETDFYNLMGYLLSQHPKP